MVRRGFVCYAACLLASRGQHQTHIIKVRMQLVFTVRQFVPAFFTCVDRVVVAVHVTQAGLQHRHEGQRSVAVEFAAC